MSYIERDQYILPRTMTQSHSQQRPQNAQSTDLNQGRHPGHPGRTAAAEGTDQHRLGLVSRMMPEQQMQNALTRTGRDQHAEPRHPRTFRQRRAPG
jgi:hypothetical protein